MLPGRTRPGLLLPSRRPPAVAELLESRRLFSTSESGLPAYDHFLYYPEGFAGSTITEFLPIGNPNAPSAQYRVIAHFEADLPDLVLAEGTLFGNHRGGITISRATDHADDLVAQGLPYALEVQSTEPLVASLSHYDFGSAVGETFADTPATSWALPQVGTGPGRRDFVVWYNTGALAPNVTVRFVAEDGTTITTVNTTTRATARGGLDLSLVEGLPEFGTFAAVVSADQPIVAAASRYFSLGDVHSASTELGTAGAGATSGVAPLGSLAGGATEEIALFDAREPISLRGVPRASVTLTFRASDESIAPIVQMVTLVQFGVTKFDVSAVASQLGTNRYSVEFASTIALVGRIVHHEHGEDAATSFAQVSAERSTFADGFMDPARAGVDVFETIGVSRIPGAPAPTRVTVIARFSTGESMSQSFGIGSSGVFFLDLHEWYALQQFVIGSGMYYYTLEVETNEPAAVGMWHYDLTLGGDTPAGGFATGAQPLVPEPGLATYDFQTAFGLGHGGGVTPIGGVLNVPLGGPSVIDLTILAGVFNFDANGQTFAGSPPVPASNMGIFDMQGAINLVGSGAVLTMASVPRPAPLNYGPQFWDGALSTDGRSISGFYSTIDLIPTLVWPAGSPRPTPGAVGVAALDDAYRFSVSITDASTPRDIVLTFTGEEGAMLAWVPLSENPPPGDGSDGSVQYIGLARTPLRPLSQLTLTIHIG